MARMPDLIVAAAVAMLLAGCFPGSHQQHEQKLSASLSAHLGNDTAGTAFYEIVATLSDSSGIRDEFPTLSFPNKQVALGHLTKQQIYALSRHANVLSIDRSKIFRPRPSP